MANTLGDSQAAQYTYVETAPLQRDKGLMRHTLIKQLDHGYVVEVGCKSFAIATKDELCKYLIRYISNPAALEEEYFKGELFKKAKK